MKLTQNVLWILPWALLAGCGGVCYITPKYIDGRWMSSINLTWQPLRVNKHSAEVRLIVAVCLLWWIDSSIHLFQSLFHFMQLFFHALVYLSFCSASFLAHWGGFPALFGFHHLAHLLALHHNLCMFFSPPTALNFPSVVVLNEITARAIGVDVVGTRSLQPWVQPLIFCQ